MTWLLTLEGIAVVLGLGALTYAAYVRRVSLAARIGLVGRRGVLDDEPVASDPERTDAGPTVARPPETVPDLPGPPVSHPWPSVTVVPTEHSR